MCKALREPSQRQHSVLQLVQVCTDLCKAVKTMENLSRKVRNLKACHLEFPLGRCLKMPTADPHRVVNTGRQALSMSFGPKELPASPGSVPIHNGKSLDAGSAATPSCQVLSS